MKLTRRTRLVLITSITLGLIAGVVILTASPPKMGFLSPGPLAKDHTDLEGEQNCSKCHVPGGGLSDGLCLKCHEPLAQRIAAKTGFHADLKHACNDCHSEHHGTDYQMIRWPAAKAPFQPIQAKKAKQEDFPHGPGTGFELTGAHQPLKCTDCHIKTLVIDQKVIDFKKEQVTFLGLGSTCGGCHHDPHLPSLGDECEKCHTDEKWTPAPEFKHDKTRYALQGKHAQVKCNECHLAPAPKEAPALGKPPVPTFKPILAKDNPRPFRGRGFGKAPATPVKGEVLPQCFNCHENPHRGGSQKFARCDECHTPKAWTQATTASFDHDQTSFPLTGKHRQVSCADCHGKKLDKPKRTRCVDCHQKDDLKAHQGGFDREMAVARQSCEQCHTTQEWKPSSYVKKKHPLPLIEGHAVKCEECHGKTAKYPRLPASPPAKIGPLRQDCKACHGDPHKGKLSQDCASCHGYKKWHLADLDAAGHAKIGFPIKDAHLQVKCEQCHGGRNAEGNLRKMALAEVKVAGCVACHTDAHAGQMTTTKCGECHTEKKWVPSKYTEVRHEKTRLPLRRAHRAVPCEVCHKRELPKVKGFKHKTMRFKWGGAGKLDCAKCHQDPHQGQFTASCSSCHGYKGFIPSTFDAPRGHEALRFPLKGPHKVKCSKCHVTGLRHGKAVTYKGTPSNCSGCHEDIHFGQFADKKGGCLSCHKLPAWKPTTFDHDRCRFPLTGKHKQVKCSSCHLTVTRKNRLGVARKVVHYYPIGKRACGDCHQNPHGKSKKKK